MFTRRDVTQTGILRGIPPCFFFSSSFFICPSLKKNEVKGERALCMYYITHKKRAESQRSPVEGRNKRNVGKKHARAHVLSIETHTCCSITHAAFFVDRDVDSGVPTQG